MTLGGLAEPGALAPWLTLAGLGAFHGVNPAMGWLFAVALGLQEGTRGAVLRALPPIALGHAASVGVVVAAAAAASAVVPAPALRLAGGLAVLAVGLYKLVRRARHPRWVGMRVGFRDLTLWSFLMSSAHGAGLMLVPLVLAVPAPAGGHAAHAQHAAAHAALVPAAGPVAVVAVHSAAMLAVAGAIALAVYGFVGVDFLRRAWLNLDVAWGAALVLAGVATLLL